MIGQRKLFFFRESLGHFKNPRHFSTRLLVSPQISKTSNERHDNYRVVVFAILNLPSSILVLFPLLRPARRKFIGDADVIQDARDHGVHEFDDGFRAGIETRVRRNQRHAGEQ